MDCLLLRSAVWLYLALKILILFTISYFLFFTIFARGPVCVRLRQPDSRNKNKDDNSLFYSLASSATSATNLDNLPEGLKSNPGINGSIDPSPFYSLPSYKSSEDLVRMAANSSYYQHPNAPGYLKYLLYKE